MKVETWPATVNVAFNAFFIMIGCRYILGADFAQSAIEAAVVTLFISIAHTLIRRTIFIAEHAQTASFFDDIIGPLADDRVLGMVLATGLAVIAGCTMIGWLFAGLFTVIAFNFVYGWVACLAALHAVSAEKEATSSDPDAASDN